MNQEIDESTDPFLDDETRSPDIQPPDIQVTDIHPTDGPIVVPDPDDRYLRLLAEFDNFRRRSY